MSTHSNRPLQQPVNDYKRFMKQPNLLLTVPNSDTDFDGSKTTQEIEILREDDPDREDLPEVDPLDDEPLEDKPFPEDPLGNDLPEFDPPEEEEASELMPRSTK